MELGESVEDIALDGDGVVDIFGILIVEEHEFVDRDAKNRDKGAGGIFVSFEIIFDLTGRFQGDALGNSGEFTFTDCYCFRFPSLNGFEGFGFNMQFAADLGLRDAVAEHGNDLTINAGAGAF
jgi:hypothetical protein